MTPSFSLSDCEYYKKVSGYEPEEIILLSFVVYMRGRIAVVVRQLACVRERVGVHWLRCVCACACVRVQWLRCVCACACMHVHWLLGVRVRVCLCALTLLASKTTGMGV